MSFEKRYSEDEESNFNDEEENEDEFDSEENEDYEDRPRKKKKKRNAATAFIIDEAGLEVSFLSCAFNLAEERDGEFLVYSIC